MDIKSERESDDKLPVTRLAVERRRVDVAPPRCRLASPISGLRLGWGCEGRVCQVRSVEDIEKLCPDLERHPLLRPEHPAETHLFGGAAFIPEVAVIRSRSAPGPRCWIRPCGRIQDEVPIRIDAVGNSGPSSKAAGPERDSSAYSGTTVNSG
jgi:hypothetical protein